MFGVYVLIDDRHVLDAQKVFVSMALINILKAPLSQLPFAMSTTMQVSSITAIQIFERLCIYIFVYFQVNYQKEVIFVSKAVVSLKRLGKFLCQDELKPDSVERAPYNPGEYISLSLFCFQTFLKLSII